MSDTTTITVVAGDGETVIDPVTATVTVVGTVPAGPPGPAGPAGATGATGATGAAGADGAPGVVQSVVAGTNVTVDSTDPANPVVSSTGTGGGAVDSVDGQTGIVDLSGSYQPLDSDLSAIAALSTTAFGRSLLALVDAAAGRTAFALGTAATQDSGAFDAAGAAAAAQAASQPLDSDLTAIAALSTTSYGRAFLALADAAAGRTALGLGTAATSASTDFQPADSDLTAIAALTTTSYGRAFLALADAAAGRTALGLGTAATNATGDFDVAGAAAAAQAASQPLDSDLTAIAALSTTSYGRSLLAAADATALRVLAGTVIGTNVQAWDADLDAIAALATTSFGRSVLTQADAAALRSLAGLVIGTNVQAFDADLSTYAGITPGALGQAILPMTTLTNHGLVLGAGAAAPTALAPDSGTTKFLKNSVASDAPTWQTIAESDVTNLTTDLGALQTQTAVQAAQIAANLAAQNGYYFGQGLVYSPSATAGKLDRTAGIGLFGTVEGKGAAATAIGSTVATLGAALTAGQAMWVNLEVDSTGGTNFNSGTPAAAADAQIPGTTAGRVSRGGIYIPFSAVALNAIDALLTTNNGNAKFYDWGITNGGPGPTGWQYDQNTWTFVSSTTGTGGGVITFKVVGINVTGYLKPGTLVSWDDGTNVPGYGVIASSSFSTDTTITLIAQSDYVMANHAIIYPRYSYVAAPLGFPSEFNWAGTLTGWGATPPTLPHNTWSPRPGARIAISIHYGSAGTSTATAHTLGLPVTARTVSNGSWDSAGKFTDNAVSTIGAAVVASGGTTVSLQGLISTNANTGSGSSTILGVQLEYPY